MQTVGITGGTGLIGQNLIPILINKGYTIVIFTRQKKIKNTNINPNYSYWNPEKNECDIESIKNLDAIVHLAGAGIADKRWTAIRKKEILNSRIAGTQFLLSQIKAHAPNCQTFIGASAIGFYGTDSSNISFTEDMKPGNDFLSNVCQKWENAEKQFEAIMRTVIFRFGIVFAKQGGAYAKLAKPMSFGIMPILGSGRQIVSWIHIDDLCRMILFAIENENIKGVYNAVAPLPVTHKELMKTIANEKGGIKIPAPAPAFLLKIIFGEMSNEVLKSTTVSAGKILNGGFTFHFNAIRDAVHALEH